MALWVKDLALPLLYHGLDPWPENFCLLWAGQKKKDHIKAKGKTPVKSMNAPKKATTG